MIEGLLNSTSTREILASFDPFGFNFNFDESLYPHLPNPPRSAGSPPSGEMRKVSADEGLSAIRAMLGGTPSPLLAHELTHVLQMTATSAGMRAFLAHHVYDSRCMDLIAGVAAQSHGVIRLRLQDLLLSSTDQELGSRISSILDMFVGEVQVNGGLQLPLADIHSHMTFSILDGKLIYCENAPPLDRPAWCVDLTSFGGPAETAVTLGNMQVYEGYALAVEDLRAAVDWETEQQDVGATEFVPPSASAPFQPYKVLRWIYDTIAGSLGSRWDSAAEFVAVLDAVLMCDAFLVESKQAPVSPMGNFIAICDHIGRRRTTLRLTSWDKQGVETFQDTLLRVVDAPVPSVKQLTLMAKEKYQRLLDSVISLNPFMAPLRLGWSSLFDSQLSLRSDVAGGACSAFVFIFSPFETLRDYLSIGPMLSTMRSPITDGDAGHTIEVLATPHYRQLINEIVLLGRQPCPIRPTCDLPDRAACHGITDQLQSEGRRCPREYAIRRVMGTGITHFEEPPSR